jgi:predicted permease
MALDAIALVLFLFALGALCSRWRLLPESAAEVLHRFVLYLCLPAAVLRYASRLHFEPGLLALIAIPWLVLLAGIALVYPAARWLRLEDGERAVLLLCVPLANTSFLGYPLVEALLGPEALPYAVIYDQFGSFMMLSTWGLWVLARYGGEAAPTARTIARRIVTFPPFLALAVALGVMPEHPPALLEALLRRLSDALLPIVAVAVGFEIRLRLSRRELKPLAAGLGLKLLVLPAVAWGLVKLFGLAVVPARTAVLETAMPAMITAAALASSHRLAPRLAAALVAYGVIVALGTLPVWTWLLR